MFGVSVSLIWMYSPVSAWGSPPPGAVSPGSGTSERNGFRSPTGEHGVSVASPLSRAGSAAKIRPLAPCTKARKYSTEPVSTSMKARQWIAPQPGISNVKRISVTR